MSASGVSASQGANLMASVQASLMRKAMDNEKQEMQSLLKALPQQSQNPPNLGNNLDVYA